MRPIKEINQAMVSSLETQKYFSNGIPSVSRVVGLCSIEEFPFSCLKFVLFSLRTILLPVLYGCETWSLTLREGRRLRVFENRVLRILFGPKRDELRGEWRKLHNEKLHDLYSSHTIVRVIK
jgi:hypothetical protein